MLSIYSLCRSNETTEGVEQSKVMTWSEKSCYILINVLLMVGCITCFSEESIFEDEDIYRIALPPANTTGMTAPGTKWCGPGNTAANYNDLGKHRDTDACCRDHDHCEEIVESQQMLHGVINTDWFPILKCSCEQKFINCLQAVNSVISNALGHIYYSARGKCLAMGHPVMSCKQYQEGTFRKRCIRYNIDKNKSQIWQLYDMPFYTTMNNNGR